MMDIDIEQETTPLKDSKRSKTVEDRKLLPRKLKYLTAAAIFYGNIAFGCAFNTYGPTITSFEIKYNSDAATISKVFSILTSCYMIGALAVGFIYNYVNRQLAVLTVLGTLAAMMLLTPHCPTINSFFVTAAIVGLCGGCYDTSQIVWMMEMMQRDCPPYVQSQHFFYALGANFGSLIMAPFLEKDEVTITTAPGVDDGFSNESLQKAAKNVADDSNDNSKLFIPYLIVGIVILIASAMQLLLFIFLRYFPPPPEQGPRNLSQRTVSTNEERPEIVNYSDNATRGKWSMPKFRFVVLTCCFISVYQGMEVCTFQFFPKFGQNSDFRLTESESAYTLTGMTAAFAIGRAISIIIVFKISNQLILCGNLVLISIANILLITWAKSSLTMLWASSILFGFGFSSVYASFTAYVERYLHFTNSIGSILLVCGSGVASIYPLIIGGLIEENPIVLSYVIFFSIGVQIISLGSLSYLTFKSKTKYV